jgi:hypothetical protein
MLLVACGSGGGLDTVCVAQTLEGAWEVVLNGEGGAIQVESATNEGTWWIAIPRNCPIEQECIPDTAGGSVRLTGLGNRWVSLVLGHDGATADVIAYAINPLYLSGMVQDSGIDHVPVHAPMALYRRLP